MTERHLHSDPPTAAEIAAATARRRRRDRPRRPRRSTCARVATLVGLAGSVTTITAHALRLPAYDPARIHLASLPVDAGRRGLHRAAGA